MYDKFYGLSERPFTIVPNPGYLYMSQKHKLALAHLRYGLLEGTGFVVLTGGIGTGKTTLIRFLLGKIQESVDVAVVFNTNVTGAELLRLIVREFEAGVPGTDKSANLAMLNEFLIERFSQGRHAIVIIDEAQNLSRDALEEVRLLSNLQGSSKPLLQVVLVGQPELRRKLADPSLEQLAQRITSTFHLGPLSLDEAREYIHFRLTQAGGRADLFDDEAIAAVHEAAGGVPRVMNILCDSALVHGYADELPVITAEVVLGVVADMAEVLGPKPQEEPSKPVAPTDLEGRVVALERNVKILLEKFGAWNLDSQRLSSEVQGLKGDFLFLQAEMVAEAARTKRATETHEGPPPRPEEKPEVRDDAASVERLPKGFFERVRWLVNGDQ